MTSVKNGLFILLFIAINMYAQDYHKIIPSSPQVYAFGQYIDNPVGYHTGIPNISIPIYTIIEGKANVPITLSYHASGIKVEQEATWVGLGWTLSAGGMISRSKLGIPDRIGEKGARGADPLLNTNNYTGKEAYEYYYEMHSGFKDTQSDVFYYNFLGYSGKFILNDLGNPISLETNNIVIKPIGEPSALGGQDIGGWELITEDGTKYSFGVEADYQEKLRNNVPQNREEYTSGWYLKEILYVNGQKLLFTYNSEDLEYIPRGGIKVSQDYHIYTNDGQVNNSYRYIDISYFQKRLTSIEGKNIKVIFEANKLRADINSSNSYALTKIRVLTKDDVPIRSFEFKSSYFQNSDNDEYDVKRLRLDEVKELSSDERQIGQYWKFYYNDLMLPSKNSCAQDLFGYFNGKTNNTSLVPIIKETINASEYNPNWYYPCGYDGLPAITITKGEADRTANEEYMMACMIDSIVYPTGGSTKYVFEPHSYNFIGKEEITTTKIGGGLRIKEIRNYADESFMKTFYTYKMLELSNGVTETNISSGVLNNNPRFYTLRSVLESNGSCEYGEWKTPILTISATPTYRLSLTHGSPVGYRQVKVQTLSGDKNNGSEIYNFSSAYEFPDIFRYSIPGNATLYNKNYSFGFGMSKWDSYFCNMSVMYGSISYEKKRGLLRQKLTLNNLDDTVNKTTYLYFSDLILANYNYCAIQEALGTYSDNCLKPLYGYSFIVAPVYYCTNQLTRVFSHDYFNGKEIYTDKIYTYAHNQLKEVETKDSKGDVFTTTYLYPPDLIYQSPIFSEMTDKNILQPPVFVKEIKNDKLIDFSLTRYKKWPGDIIAPSENYASIGSPPVSYMPWQCSLSSIHYNEILLWGNYGETGLNTYSFNNDATNSELELNLESIQQTGAFSMYLYNVTNDEAELLYQSTEGKSSFFKEIPLEDNCQYEVKFQSIGEIGIQGSMDVSSYSQCNFVEDPSFIRKTVTFDNYDDYGNLLQYHKEDDINVSYLWGYNNTYPIAKVENATSINTETEVTESNEITDEISFTNNEGYLSGHFNLGADYEKVTLSMIFSNLLNQVQIKIDGNVVYDTYVMSDGEKTFSVNDLSEGNHSWTANIINEDPTANSNVEVSRVTAQRTISSTDMQASVFPFHTSFEEDEAKTNGDYYKTGNKCHTGSYDLYLPPVIEGNNKLLVSFWGKTSDAADWTYIEETIVPPGSATTKTIGNGYAYIDEVRVYPADALMTTYTYDPLVGMTSVTDARNRVTYYIYDDFGRLIEVKDHENKVLESYKYHYAK